MRFSIVCVLVFAAAAQQQHYSSKSAAPPSASNSGGARIKNAMEFTPDGIFLQGAAVDNVFAIEFGIWAKSHGENPIVRSTAGELAGLETKFGDSIRKLAGKKHVTMPERLNDRDLNALHAKDNDQAFIEQLLWRYDQEIVGFQREALSGSDPEIRNFAAGGVAILQKHRRMIEALQQKPQ